MTVPAERKVQRLDVAASNSPLRQRRQGGNGPLGEEDHPSSSGGPYSRTASSRVTKARAERR